MTSTVNLLSGANLQLLASAIAIPRNPALASELFESVVAPDTTAAVEYTSFPTRVPTGKVTATHLFSHACEPRAALDRHRKLEVSRDVFRPVEAQVDRKEIPTTGA